MNSLIIEIVKECRSHVSGFQQRWRSELHDAPAARVGWPRSRTQNLQKSVFVQEKMEAYKSRDLKPLTNVHYVNLLSHQM